MKLKELVCHLEKYFPNSVSSPDDNCGLQLGDLNSNIKKVIIALECTSRVISFAIENKADCIITHHPLLYKATKNITTNSEQGRIIHRAISNNIAIYSMHTNVDALGLNHYLANLLDLNVKRPIELLSNTSFVKFVTFIPKDNAEKVRHELLDAGLGMIGNYSHCSFNILGTGTYLPGENTTPFIGEKGKLEETQEIRFESILLNKDVNKAIQILKKVHPYEEVAYDLYPLKNLEGLPGLGCYCSPKTTFTLKELLKVIPKKLDINFVRYYDAGDETKTLKNIAICTGSGSFLLSKLSNVDLIITGDITYHDAMNAASKEISFIDIGHEQEKIFIPFLYDKLKPLSEKLLLIKYDKTLNPFKILNYKENEL